MEVKNFYCSNPKEEIHYTQKATPEVIDVQWEEADSWEAEEKSEITTPSRGQRFIEGFLSVRVNLYALARWLIAWALIILIASIIVK